MHVSGVSRLTDTVGRGQGFSDGHYKGTNTSNLVSMPIICYYLDG